MRREPLPLTNTELFEEFVPYPTTTPLLPEIRSAKTAPPLDIERLFPLPLKPTVRSKLLLHEEPFPVTTTELLEELVP